MLRTRFVCAVIASSAWCSLPGFSQEQQSSLGLQVNAQGVLIKDGQPYRGVGVNYFSLFYDRVKDPKHEGYRDGLKALADRGIPFVRFMASGFWPAECKLYFDDPKAYFKLFDEVVKAAEEIGVGLIPSFFWCSSTVPDLVGEPLNQWGNRESKTHAFLAKYIQELVTRYKTSPAIWGWEFGNEYNLSADLPNASEHRPAIVTDLGTPASRSQMDEMTHAMVRTALKAFAEEVRKLDRDRIILSGNALPRASAWHQMKELNWNHDSQEQYAEMLRGDNPDPMNTLCVHVYGEEDRFDRKVSHQELLALTMEFAAKEKKPLFVGEFGAPGDEGQDKEKVEFNKLLTAIEKTGVPLAALWVYNFPGQDEVWNVTPGNRRAYQLQAISELNGRMKSPATANQDPH